MRGRSTIRQRFKEFPALFKGDRSFGFFTIAQVLASAGAFAQPFYILSVGHRIHLTGALLGSLSLAFLGADTATNLGWGYMGDKFGFRSTFLLSLALWAGATLLLIFAHSLPAVILAFFCIGSAQSGQQMSSSTMVLEFGHRDEIAMRLAVSQTAQGSMRALGPLLGGLVASTLGYNFLFSVSLFFLLASLVVLTTLVQEPRNRRAALMGET